MIQEPLPPILRRIDLEHDLDLALALRRAGRPKRRAASLKGWATRRDSRLKPLVETACGLDAKHESGGSRREIAQSQPVNPSNNPPKSNTETAA